MYKEGTTRPHTMKLDLVNLQKHHYSLTEFEEDEIEEFEGWDLVELREDPDAEDMTWLFPSRGPGEFKDLKEKAERKKKAK